jgi:putative Mg2+ transporter-C (MgtC) family protein
MLNIFGFEANIVTMLTQIVVAAALGGIIGLEREFLKKAAGLRTFVMVSSGCALFTIVSINGFAEFIGKTNFDPSRIASGILAGIGFIGAGTILKRKDKIEGITTAAAMWIAAAIGMAVGAELYYIAIFTSVFTFFLLIILRPFEFWLNKRT